LVLLPRVLFAWLIDDGDMHLKNMALQKTGYSGETTFRRVTLAPVYDALTTRVFPGLHHDRMALKLGGKDDGLRRADFVGLATRSGLRAGDARAAIDDLLQRLSPALDALAIPPALQLDPEARATVARTLEICRKRVAEFH
ncbi:MAG: HipA domain-containing protein, partial [Gammaproteobacteria bacterium]|nr:HipA domain-containing protein [Gammaproteobacteria bacterium]